MFHCVRSFKRLLVFSLLVAYLIALQSGQLIHQTYHFLGSSHPPTFLKALTDDPHSSVKTHFPDAAIQETFKDNCVIGSLLHGFVQITDCIPSPQIQVFWGHKLQNFGVWAIAQLTFQFSYQAAMPRGPPTTV